MIFHSYSNDGYQELKDHVLLTIKKILNILNKAILKFFQNKLQYNCKKIEVVAI